MTMPDWQPDSWLGLTIASMPCFKWENIQDDDIQTKMPELLQRLNNLTTGNFVRQRIRRTEQLPSATRDHSDENQNHEE